MMQRLVTRLLRWLPAAWPSPWSNPVMHVNLPSPRTTVIRLGRFYMQQSGGWGQLSTASTFTEKQFRKVWALYPNASWLTVLESDADHTEPG